MEIYVYKGTFELPSIDLNCLRTLTYIRLTEAPVKINHKSNPHNSKNGFLPYLTDGENNKAGYDEITDYLKLKGYDLNSSLDTNDEQTVLGLILQLNYKLNPAFQYILWGQPLNVNDTRLMYSKQVPFPYNFYYPKKYINNASNVLSMLKDIEIDEKVEESEIDMLMHDTKTFVTQTSAKLCKELWLLKKQPTEYDVAIYAYLAILSKIKLNNNPLGTHIKDFPNLVNFIDRINKKYFKDDIFKFEDLINTKSNNNGSSPTTKSSESDEDKGNWKIQIFAGLGAIVAMLTYAISRGILAISVEPNDDSFIEYSEQNDDYE